MRNGECQINSNLIFRTILLTLAASFVYAMYAGIRNNYGIMLHSIVKSAGISFASVSFVLAVGQLLFGLVQPVFGILASKRGNVYAFVSGVALTVTGMVLTPLCKSTITLMICLGILLPAGTGAISFGLLMGILTPKIPPKTVSFVSGIVNASSGIGNTILSPVINTLIMTGGLMYSMLVLCIPVAMTLPVSLLFVRKKRARNPVMTETTGRSQSEIAKISIKFLLLKALKNRTYLLLMIGFFTCGFHMALITNHLPTQIQSFGFSSENAAYAFAIYGIVTVIGSVLSGILCGKLKMKYVLGFYYGLRPITILLFLILPKTLFIITLFTALFGFSGASTVPPVSGILNKAFGHENLATLFGLVFFVHQTGGFFGAWLGGICFDMTGSYSGIWIVSIIFSTAASIISFAINETESDFYMVLKNA